MKRLKIPLAVIREKPHMRDIDLIPRKLEHETQCQPLRLPDTANLFSNTTASPSRSLARSKDVAAILCKQIRARDD